MSLKYISFIYLKYEQRYQLIHYGRKLFLKYQLMESIQEVQIMNFLKSLFFVTRIYGYF